MEKSKSLSYYFGLIDSAIEKQNWEKSSYYSRIALKNLSKFHHAPKEKYLLYVKLGYSCYSLSEYSQSLDIFYKAYLTAIKNRLRPADVAYALFGMGHNYAATKNVTQALIKYRQVEEYYQKYGDGIFPMDSRRLINLLVNLGYCYLYKKEFNSVRQILEEKFIKYQDILSSNKRTFMEYNHLKGEYLMAIEEYKESREYFLKSVETSEEIGSYSVSLNSQIHLSAIDVLNGDVSSAISRLQTVMDRALKLKLYREVCESGVILGKCYLIKRMAQKASVIERQIKPYLNKIDILWFYEISKEYEQLYRKVLEVNRSDLSTHSSIPKMILNIIDKRYTFSSYNNAIIGKSKAMLEIYNLIEKISPTDLPVLIQGETGTGKELIARAIHYSGPRSKKPYLALNCSALPETLFENELFGHTKGAFTDATSEKKGYLELTSGGTLFIDEVIDMPLHLQQKLLRVLEEKQIWQVGAEKSTSINTRFIFASNKNVEELVKKKLFREDLFYRMNTIVITLPPLRERKDDIPLLINHFLTKYSCSSSIVPHALRLLVDYSWPGNVRELENEIRRICTLYSKVKVITAEMLSENIRNHKPLVSSVDNLKSIKGLRDSYERNLIMESLGKCGGSVSKAAKLLECSRLYLYRRIAKLKIRTDGITKK